MFANAIREFMKLESTAGLLLLAAAIAAMLVANSPLAPIYGDLLNTTVAVQVGALEINKPLLLWVNDGLMAVFFFLIGLEIKREIMEGELSSFKQVILPGMGALGGMSMSDFNHPVTLGVILGLFLGKPVGIMLFVGLAVGLRLVQLPGNVNWMQILGVALACGIGFTMSLFIAGLAFEHGSGAYFIGDRLGIVLGSILSALAAYLLLHLNLPKSSPASASVDNPG